jgi:hypothetical protein
MQYGVWASTLCLSILNCTALAVDPVTPKQLPPKTPTIALKLEGMVTLKQAPFDKEIPFLLTLKNSTTGEVRFQTFDVKPNSWNGETIHITLVDIYRDGEKRNLYLERPKVEPPKKVSGMRSISLEPGQSTLIRSDIRKWKIDGGWSIGKYQVTARIENLTTDNGRCTVSVLSEPFEFEIVRH